MKRILSILLIGCLLMCSALAEKRYYDLSTMTVAELDALSEQIRQEKKAATSITSETEKKLKADFKSHVESLMPEGTSFSYPFFGLDIERERELYTVSGTVGCKKPDKTKINLNNATIHYWYDNATKTYYPVAFYTKENVYYVDATKLEHIKRYLDKQTVKRLSNASQSLSDDSSTALRSGVTPTPSPTPKPTATPKPTPKPTATKVSTPKPTQNIGQVSSDTLTLRAEPSRYSKALSSLKSGDYVTIISSTYSESEYWYFVDYPTKNLRGYVLSDYISSGNTSVLTRGGIPNNQGPVSSKMRVNISATCTSGYNHVGNNWSQAFWINNQKVRSGSTIQLAVGDVITIKAEVEESDSVPDYGSDQENHTITQDDLDKGFTVVLWVYVSENRGRYSGSTAEWKVTYKFTK